MAVKNNIKIFRKEMGLRQGDVAKVVDVSRQTIIAIETERYNPSLELAMKLARLFGKPIEEIFELSEG